MELRYQTKGRNRFVRFNVVDVTVSQLGGQELFFVANSVAKRTARNDENCHEGNPRLQGSPSPMNATNTLAPRCATTCYMERVGIRELRQNATAVLRRVAAGEVVEVTDRGRAVARIVPMHEASRLEQLLAEGRASGATGDLLDVKPMRRVAGKPLLSEILAGMRTDER